LTETGTECFPLPVFFDRSILEHETKGGPLDVAPAFIYN